MVAKVTRTLDDDESPCEDQPDTDAGDLSVSTGSELLEEALARVSRLEAAVAVSSGTIHDINNLMTVLSGNLFILTESVRDNEKLYEKVRTARNAAEKCGALMRELLTFSRDADRDEQVICPAHHLESLLPLLRRSVGARHTVEISLQENPWSVEASAVQFESAVTNLVVNARDALPNVGTIEISADNVEVTAPMARELGVADGDFVRTRVSDNGAGIPASLLSKVREPLFTTKRKSGGCGLGLSMVSRFAAKSSGTLTVNSTEGIGTEVEIWLPRSLKDAEVTANMTLPLSTLKCGDETVILVSRDEAVRAAIRDILEALGYSVVLAALGQDVKQHPQIDLSASVLVCDRTDETSEFENGWIDDLKQECPQLRHVAILSTDACPDETAPNADAWLRRPIAVMQLANAMRDALENKL